MAGIYIKDMAMPHACLECYFFNGDGCLVTKTIFHPMTNVAARTNECPLIPVPDFEGDLLDMGKLSDGFKQAIDDSITNVADEDNSEKFFDKLRDLMKKATVIKGAE